MVEEKNNVLLKLYLYKNVKNFLCYQNNFKQKCVIYHFIFNIEIFYFIYTFLFKFLINYVKRLYKLLLKVIRIKLKTNENVYKTNVKL